MFGFIFLIQLCYQISNLKFGKDLTNGEPDLTWDSRARSTTDPPGPGTNRTRTLSIDVPEFIPISQLLSFDPADVVSPAGDFAPVQMTNRVAGIQPYQENLPMFQPSHHLSPKEPMTPTSRLQMNFGMMGSVKLGSVKLEQVEIFNSCSNIRSGSSGFCKKLINFFTLKN